MRSITLGQKDTRCFDHVAVVETDDLYAVFAFDVDH